MDILFYVITTFAIPERRKYRFFGSESSTAKYRYFKSTLSSVISRNSDRHTNYNPKVLLFCELVALRITKFTFCIHATYFYCTIMTTTTKLLTWLRFIYLY